jgi:hypothetical protein
MSGFEIIGAISITFLHRQKLTNSDRPEQPAQWGFACRFERGIRIERLAARIRPAVHTLACKT